MSNCVTAAGKIKTARERAAEELDFRPRGIFKALKKLSHHRERRIAVREIRNEVAA